MKQGRTFVTNNPMLTFTVNGREAGSTLPVQSGKDKVVRTHARAESQLPYDRLEIARMAESSVKQRRPAIGTRPKSISNIRSRRAAGSPRAPPRISCGIQASNWQDPPHGRHAAHSLYGTRRPENVFAHTSPVYVIRDGKPIPTGTTRSSYVQYMESAIRWFSKKARFSSARTAGRSSKNGPGDEGRGAHG